jgi:HEAT repeat protein
MAEKLSFQNVLDHLLDSKKDIPEGHLKFYSDLDPKSLRLFLDIWPRVNPTRKLLLLDRLLSHLDTDTIVSYEEIGRALLDDRNGKVRARAIRLLAESDDPKLADKLTDIFLNDVDLAPRMESAQLLGEFILLGELDKINEAQKRKVEDALISVIRGEEHSTLRKRALESMGFSSRNELLALIESAFERSDPAWVASALRAMGRSQDSRWDEDVVSMLLDEETPVKFAAVEAAGQLAIQEAVPILLQILDDEEEDDDVALAAIWSLSQIGGEDARTYLVALAEQNEDEDLVEFLEDALENLNFTEELEQFDMLVLDEDDVEDELDEDQEDDEEDKE